MFRFKFFLLLTLTWGGLALSQSQKTHYLAVGGGYNTFGSQATLEYNIKLFQKLVGKRHSADYLFGSGTQEDLCDVLVKTRELSIADRLFFDLVGMTDYEQELLECDARHHTIAGITSSATVEALSDVLFEQASEDLVKNWRFYYTGHGSSGTLEGEGLEGIGDENPMERVDFFNSFENLGGNFLNKAHPVLNRNRYNANTLDLWNNFQMSVQEFTEALDQFPKDQEQQLLMVQCYSGGFSQINYEGGVLDLDHLSNRNRCGFFSQLPNRLASGCTTDIHSKEEYSRYFFSAFRRRDEDGKPTNADYNGDGSISSNEAHAYVIINEKSVDIPITTSSQLLRDIEVFRKLEVPPKIENEIWKHIYPRLQKDERAIFKKVGVLLGVNWGDLEEPLYKYLKNEIKEIESSLNEIERSMQEYAGEKTSEFDDLSDVLEQRFPIIFSRVDMLGLPKLMSQKQKALSKSRAYLNQHPKFQKLIESYKFLDQKEAEVYQLERTKALWERLAYLARTKQLEQTISKAENFGNYIKKYSILKKCEHKSFF